MKKLLICILILSSAIFLSGSYYEENVDEQLEIAAESGISSAVPEEAAKLLEKIGIDDIDADSLASLSFKDVFVLIVESLAEKIKQPFYAVITVMVAGILCTLVHSLGESVGKTGTVYNTVCTITVAVSVILPMKEVISSAARVIEECSSFMLAFVPVYYSVITASGYVSSGMGYRTLMLGAVTAVSRIAGQIVTPLICIYLAICVAGIASPVDIGGISKCVKNFAVWVLSGTMALFSGVMGLGSIVSASADGVGYKAAKFIVGSSVPVVGGTISDALAAMKGCLLMTKNILGAYAIIVTAAIFIPALISLLSWKICLAAGAAVGELCGNKTLSSLLTSSSSVMGIMLALIITTGAMFIFSVAIMLMAGGAIG